MMRMGHRQRSRATLTSENVDAVSSEQVARRVDFIPQQSDVESRELELGRRDAVELLAAV